MSSDLSNYAITIDVPAAPTPPALDELIDECIITPTSLSVSYGRTISDGNYGNDKYSAHLTVELAEDADVYRVYRAVHETVRGEIERQVAYRTLLDDLSEKLRSTWQETPESYRDKAHALLAHPDLLGRDRAWLGELAIKQLDALFEKERKQQAKERREAEERALRLRVVEEAIARARRCIERGKLAGAWELAISDLLSDHRKELGYYLSDCLERIPPSELTATGAEEIVERYTHRSYPRAIAVLEEPDGDDDDAWEGPYDDEDEDEDAYGDEEYQEPASW